MRGRAVVVILLSGLFAACGGGPDAGSLIDDYVRAVPLRFSDSTLSLPAAYAVQDAFVEGLWDSLGPVAGYKAALTSRAAQERFGMTHPVSGVLLRGMLLSDGIVIPHGRAYRPMIEGDLLVRVSNESMNNARSREDVLAAIDQAIPFAEIPDVLFDPSRRITASMLVAANAGARFGVVGKAVPLAHGIDWIAVLPAFRVRITSESGATLAVGKGESLLGHPLDAALWLVRNLNERGIRLKKGDLLSLGSLTPLLSLQSPERLDLVYEGLDPSGTITVRVRFE